MLLLKTLNTVFEYCAHNVIGEHGVYQVIGALGAYVAGKHCVSKIVGENV